MKTKSAAFITEAVFKTETKIIHGDIQSLKSDMQLLKMDVEVLKDDVKVLKDDVKILKSDVHSLKGSVNRLALAVVKTQGDVADIRNDMKSLATKDDIHRVLNQMTDFSKETRIVLQNQEVHRGYIHDHEERLIALEKRP